MARVLVLIVSIFIVVPCLRAQTTTPQPGNRAELLAPNKIDPPDSSGLEVDALRNVEPARADPSKAPLSEAPLSEAPSDEAQSDEDILTLGAVRAEAAKNGLAQGVDPRCRTPRAAIEGLLRFLQPHRFFPDRAAVCIQGARLSPKERRTRAQQIKEYLDGMGLYVDVEGLPADENFRDSAGEQRFVLFSSHPDIYVVRGVQQNGQSAWLWSAETVSIIPRLHAQAFPLSLEQQTADLGPVWQLSLFGVRLWQGVAFSLLLLISYALRLLLGWIFEVQTRGLMHRLKVRWGEQLLDDVQRPVGILTAALFFVWVLPGLHLPVRFAQVVMGTTRFLVAFCAVWVVYKLADLFASWMQQKASQTETKLDDQLVPLMRRALKISIIAFGSMFVLQSFNVNITGLIAGFSIGGVAFALAAKDTVANLFGSATIFASRPFQIGDWVYIEGTEGIIESVGFRATKVRTFYNSLVTIPNHKVADAVVDNYGLREYRRCKVLLGLTYDTTPEKIQDFVAGVRSIIEKHPYTRKDYYEVHFYEFAASSLNILAYFFFKVPGWTEELQARNDIFLDFMRLAEDLGVSFAFPTQTLHVHSSGD